MQDPRGPHARSGGAARAPPHSPSLSHSLCRWCSRFRGRRRPPLPRGVAVSPLPRDRGSPRGAAAPACPAPASLVGLASSSAPPPRSRAGSPPERHQRASARGRRQGVRAGAGGRGRGGAVARCAAPRTGPRGRRSGRQPGPPSRLATAPPGSPARPTFPPLSSRSPVTRRRQAPPRPPLRAALRCPGPRPREVTSLPRPQRRWGLGKVRARPRRWKTGRRTRATGKPSTAQGR